MRTLLIGLLFVIAQAWSQPGSKQQEKQTEKPNSNAEVNKQIANHPPVTITVSPTITATTEPHYKTEHEEQKSSVWEFVIAISTSALAVITLGLAYFTLKLWRSTRRLVIDTQKASKRELKAYIGIVMPEVKVDWNKSELLAWIEYINAGQTPAKDVVVRMSAEVRSFASPPPSQKAGVPTDELKGGILVPNVPWRRHCPIENVSLTQQLLKELEGEKQRIWVWGTIDYIDVFHDLHHIEFRFWNSKLPKTHETKDRETGEYISLVADRTGSNATYGKD